MVWRWIVSGSTKDNRVYLGVQALPCNLATVKANPILRQDSTKAITVAEFPIGYTAFQNLPGPAPMFFSEEPETTSAALKRSPQYAFDCMQMLMSRLIETEQITREDAVKFLKDPVLGTTKAPLVRTWETVVGSSSGTKPKTAKPDKGTLPLEKIEMAGNIKLILNNEIEKLTRTMKIIFVV